MKNKTVSKSISFADIAPSAFLITCILLLIYFVMDSIVFQPLNYKRKTIDLVKQLNTYAANVPQSERDACAKKIAEIEAYNAPIEKQRLADIAKLKKPNSLIEKQEYDSKVREINKIASDYKKHDYPDLPEYSYAIGHYDWWQEFCNFSEGEFGNSFRLKGIGNRYYVYFSNEKKTFEMEKR